MKLKIALITKLFSLFSIFIFVSCSESSLSDVELADPGLIKAAFFLEAEKINNDNVKYSVVAHLSDKNNNSLSLNNGRVLLNSTAMRLRREQFTNLPYYDGYENIGGIVLKGTTYNFDIELSNGNRYQSVITTQNKILTNLNVPTTHSRNENMLITWEEIDATQPLTLIFKRTYTDSTGTKYETKTFTVPNHSLANGNYVLNRDFFNTPNTTEGEIKLESVKFGSINPSLMNGSSIRSIFTVSRKVFFTE